MSKTMFWGYVDYDQKIHVKSFTNDRAVRNAEDSGTTIGIFDPFYADNIKDATIMCLERYRSESEDEVIQ